MNDQSPMDWKRLALFFVLSLGIFVGWQYLFPPAAPPQPVVEVSEPLAAAAPVPAPEPSTNTPAPASGAVAASQVERTVVQTPRVRVELTNVGGRITSWQLLEHGEYGAQALPDEVHVPLDVVKKPIAPDDAGGADVENPLGPRRLAVDDHAPFLPLQVLTGGPTLDRTLAEALHVVELTTEPGRQVVTLTWSDGLGTSVVKKLTFADDSLAVAVEASLLVAGRPSDFHLGWGPGIGNPTRRELNNSYFKRGEVVAASGAKSKEFGRADKAGQVPSMPLTCAALDESFFAVVFIPGVPGGVDPGPVTGFSVGGTLPPRADGKKPSKKDWPDQLQLHVPFGPRVPAHTLYVGPRSREVMAALDETFGNERNVVLLARTGGILEPIAAGMRWLMVWFHSSTASWGIAILLLTVTIRTAIFPLTHVSLKKMKRFQDRIGTIKPQQDALREKYRKLERTMANRQREQQELMELYAVAGIKPTEPLMGCLPMLLSMPFFMALFYMLPREILLRQEPFLWWSDLSLSDPSHVLPILSGVTTFISSKLSSASASMDPMQKNMLYMFPIMFIWICWDAPLALVVYWTTSNIIQIGQQYLLKLTLPKPPETEAGKKLPGKGGASRKAAPALVSDAPAPRPSAATPAPAGVARKRRKR